MLESERGSMSMMKRMMVAWRGLEKKRWTGREEARHMGKEEGKKTD